MRNNNIKIVCSAIFFKVGFKIRKNEAAYRNAHRSVDFTKFIIILLLAKYNRGRPCSLYHTTQYAQTACMRNELFVCKLSYLYVIRNRLRMRMPRGKFEKESMCTLKSISEIIYFFIIVTHTCNLYKHIRT